MVHVVRQVFQNTAFSRARRVARPPRRIMRFQINDSDAKS
jgi:hypothetical protein